MPQTSAKQLLLVVMQQYEKLYKEKLALQAILMTCPHFYTRQTWKAQAEELLNDAEIQKKGHSLFVPVYEKIDSLADEAALIELLSKMPSTGQPN